MQGLRSLGHQVNCHDTFHIPWTPSRMLYLLSEVRSADVSLLMGPSLKCWLLATLARRPVLVSHHILPGGPSWTRSLRRCLSRSTRQVASSAFLASRLEEAGASCVEVIHPCFALHSASFGPPLDARRWDAAFVGRLIPEKGAHLLLLALARQDGCSNLKVQVIGDGPERGRLEAMARRLGLVVCFAGSLSGQDVELRLRDTRVAVIPSLCEESFGLVVPEALAAGCRVIAAEIGGLPEAGGELVRYVPPGQVEALASALGEEISSRAPLDLQSRRTHLRRFQPDQVARLHHTLLEGLCLRKGGAEVIS